MYRECPGLIVQDFVLSCSLSLHELARILQLAVSTRFPRTVGDQGYRKHQALIAADQIAPLKDLDLVCL